MSEKCYNILTKVAGLRGAGLDLKGTILQRVLAQSVRSVWTAVDLLDLGSREAVDQALHRLAASGELRRIARGMYDRPSINQLTGKPAYPDYRQILDALARRDQVRMVVDGITAANDLGLTDAVPARAVVLADARLRPIKLDKLTIEFRHAVPSRLHWAGHPAMRVVQSLYWLRDMLPSDDGRILKRLVAILRDPGHGQSIREDLRDGLPTLPEWMQTIVRALLLKAEEFDLSAEGRKGKKKRPHSAANDHHDDGERQRNTERGKIHHDTVHDDDLRLKTALSRSALVGAKQ